MIMYDLALNVMIMLKETADQMNNSDIASNYFWLYLVLCYKKVIKMLLLIIHCRKHFTKIF